MKKTMTTVGRFFKDKHGKWAIAQFPNAFLFVWAILLVTNLFLHNQHIGMLQSAVLLTWAYLELTDGSSSFRKTLGAVVMSGVAVGFFIH